MKSFNQLTPAEAERLALLLEELGEAQQAIGMRLLGSVVPDCLGTNADGTPRHPLYLADCLGTNADGTPRHPLYLAADTEAEAYTGRGGSR